MTLNRSERRDRATCPAPSRVAHIPSAITSRYAALRREQIAAARRLAARNCEREAQPRRPAASPPRAIAVSPFVWRSPRRGGRRLVTTAPGLAGLVAQGGSRCRNREMRRSSSASAARAWRASAGRAGSAAASARRRSAPHSLACGIDPARVAFRNLFEEFGQDGLRRGAGTAVRDRSVGAGGRAGGSGAGAGDRGAGAARRGGPRCGRAYPAVTSPARPRAAGFAGGRPIAPSSRRRSPPRSRRGMNVSRME